MRDESKILLGLLSVAVFLPVVVTDDYVMHLLIMACFYAVLASSLNVIVGYVGELSLGHTAYLGIGAYAAALSATSLGLSIGWTVAIAALAAGLAGLVIGALTLRLEGPYFVIVTLSFAEVLRIISNNWVAVTNGPMGISGVPGPHFDLGPLQFAVSSKAEFFYLALALAVVALFALHRFVYSNMGRAAVAIRESRYVAQSIGVNPFRYALVAFVLGAVFAGIAGAFYAHYITFVGPDVFGFSFMATMLIMVLIGGKGTLVGPIIGAVLVVFLEEYLRAVEEIRFSIFGILVMIVVLFFPDGLVGLRRALRRRSDRAKAAPHPSIVPSVSDVAPGMTEAEAAERNR